MKNCCCLTLLNLCDTPICGGSINIEATAPAGGEYTLILNFLNAVKSIKKTFAVSEAIIFPLTGLNENFTYTGKILNPDGSTLIIMQDGNPFTCLSFTTKLSV